MTKRQSYFPCQTALRGGGVLLAFGVVAAMRGAFAQSDGAWQPRCAPRFASYGDESA